MWIVSAERVSSSGLTVGGAPLHFSLRVVLFSSFCLLIFALLSVSFCWWTADLCRKKINFWLFNCNKAELWGWTCLCRVRGWNEHAGCKLTCKEPVCRCDSGKGSDKMQVNRLVQCFHHRSDIKQRLFSDLWPPPPGRAGWNQQNLLVPGNNKNKQTETKRKLHTNRYYFNDFYLSYSEQGIY